MISVSTVRVNESDSVRFRIKAFDRYRIWLLPLNGPSSRGVSNQQRQNDQNSIVKKINEISQIRINLYKNLNGQTGFYSDNITSSMGTLQQQKQSLYIVESELNEAKRRLALIEEDKNNK